MNEEDSLQQTIQPDGGTHPASPVSSSPGKRRAHTGLFVLIIAILLGGWWAITTFTSGDTNPTDAKDPITNTKLVDHLIDKGLTPIGEPATSSWVVPADIASNTTATRMNSVCTDQHDLADYAGTALHISRYVIGTAEENSEPPAAIVLSHGNKIVCTYIHTSDNQFEPIETFLNDPRPF